MGFNPVNWSLGEPRAPVAGEATFSEALHEIISKCGTLQPGWHGLQRLRLEYPGGVSYQRLATRNGPTACSLANA